MPFDGGGCSDNAAYSMTTARKIRVLVVDDHVMVRQGLRAVLQSYPNIDVVGEAGNGEEGISSVAKLLPAIVVMDIGMPTLDGIGATRLIKMQFPQIAVLGLSVNAPTHQVEAMLKAGAFDVITKEKAVDELYSAIQKAIAAIQPILILEEGPSEAPAAKAPQNVDVLSAKDTRFSGPEKRESAPGASWTPFPARSSFKASSPTFLRKNNV
jgi:DNA-binding NarL/FixJ family response regulator